MNVSNEPPSSIPSWRGMVADTIRPWWLPALQMLLVAAGFLLLWPTTQQLIVEWEDTDKTTYTHGFLIVLITFWLLLRGRDRLPAQGVAPSFFAALLLAGASMAWLIALRSGIQTGEHLLLPAMMWLAIWSALGWRVASLAAFAVAYLYFAIPLWGAVNELLQTATVVAVELLLRLTSVPAYVDGRIVHLSAGTFEVAGGCSGLHFFIVALALASLYGEVHRDTLRTRLKLLMLALGLALVTNWLRVYFIVLAGYLTDMQHYLVRVEHYRFGWVVFAVAMAAFFFIAGKVPATDRESVPATAHPGSSISRRDVLRGIALALMALAIGPLWNAMAPAAAAPLPDAATLLPVNLEGWAGPQTANASKWRPVFKGADAQRSGEYRSGGRTVEAFTALYARQAQGKELMGYENSVLETGTEIASRTRIEVNGPALELNVTDSAGQQSVLWYAYRIGAMQTHRSIVAQLRYSVASLGTRPVSSIVALRSRCEPDCEAARSTLQEFVRSGGWFAAAHIQKDNSP